ncbi:MULTISPECIES: 2,3-bisphosphoglycerate-independent phosphoglycerate mutase [unclassified Synechococcus]|uniref:2,3-bisphosphoglycerate-independent phosphoglycerate mutase n=1 Tax=unclassified Synechococcus TaxID=2626047 RepID=UPI001CF845A4|nr:2,3-bisphosphoglycerate-independent phosphoglycerate mutase [Synechococcus sp. MU1650]MCB4412409.1 2,3-bisphosphoglycerate-independent phosphoglycerate mutase [Synechococcus sp. MU1611]
MNVGNSTTNGSGRSGTVAPVVLAILDGWGHRDASEHNAIQQSGTPVMDALWHAYPHTLIEASGSHVGLPDQQMGNSEVGHLTIGAGRIIRQELVRISDTVRSNQLGTRPVLKALVERIQQRGGTLHLLGLCSDGGVHSHVNHLCGLIQWAADSGLSDVAVHAITDGRDTPTQSAPNYISQVEEALSRCGVGQLTSLCGRYWAMDRDQRWDRTEKAYNLYTDPEIAVDSRKPDQVLAASYAEGITDEFLEPVRLQNSVIKDGDSVLVFNFRPDRARQIVQALCLADFESFERSRVPSLDVVTFTQVEQDLPVHVVFPPEPLDQLLGQVVADAGLKQYRTAETEKYPHVTYFMNGGIEQPLDGEDRHLVPSPRVATYDLSPAMSAEQLTDSCVAAIKKAEYSLIVINYANPDMVGHTGVMDAAKEAIQTVDGCIGRLLDAVGRQGGTMLITADHGNAELMEGPDGQAWTAHTTNPVPAILIEGERRKLPGHGNGITLRDNGGLADIAPTLLQILDLPQPEAMTGLSLIAPMSNMDPSPKTARLPLSV